MKKNQPIKKPTKTEVVLKKPMDRRTFFNNAWKGVGILAAVEVVGMFAAYTFSGKPKNNSGAKHLIEAGAVETFAMNSVSAFMGGRFYLARQKDGGFIALSLRCTHLGCSVSWEEEHQRFICPCHASAFDIGGEVLSPPAARALDYYPVIIENGVVRVDIGTIKQRSSFKKEQLQYA
jgi:cytochrome b6-f complex iron-sulfur subunit